MQSFEIQKIPRSLAIITATGSVALAASVIGEQPVAQAFSYVKCETIELVIEGADAIGGRILGETIEDFAVSQYVEGMEQPDPTDVNILRNAVVIEVNQDIMNGDIRLPAKNQDAYHICVSPGSPEYVSVDSVQPV